VIVLGNYCHEGIELADTLGPSLCFGFREDAPGGHRRRWFVEKWQSKVAQVEHRKLQASPR
jgi:hypothetical protein